MEPGQFNHHIGRLVVTPVLSYNLGRLIMAPDSFVFIYPSRISLAARLWRWVHLIVIDRF